MSAFHTDSPITGSEDSPDWLNRTGFAYRIAEALLLKPGSGPLVVSLFKEACSGGLGMIPLRYVEAEYLRGILCKNS